MKKKPAQSSESLKVKALKARIAVLESEVAELELSRRVYQAKLYSFRELERLLDLKKIAAQVHSKASEVEFHIKTINRMDW